MKLRMGARCLVLLGFVIGGCGSDEAKTGTGGGGRDGSAGSTGTGAGGSTGGAGSSGGFSGAGNSDAGSDALEAGCGCVHGTCAEGGTCACDGGFAGATCSVCAAQHFGSTCQACDCGTRGCNDGLTGTGACSPCPIGFTGTSCTDCATGYFGTSCQPCTCLNGICNGTNTGDGTCSSCNTGWNGSNCTSCAAGYFGGTCQGCTCQHGTCKDGLTGDGTCSICASPWVGANCDKCPSGTWGTNCEQTCACVHATGCDQTTGACQCELGWSGPSCNATGLGLYWKFDETGGTVATDSSGNNLTGSYVTTIVGLPTPAAGAVPASMMSWDPASLSFLQGQAVQLSSMDGGVDLSLVKPLNNFSIAVWYRTGTADLDISGSELVSMGDHYILRIGQYTTGTAANNWSLEFNKYIFNSETNRNTYAQCWHLASKEAGTPNFLDGGWHHVVAIASNTAPGTALYMDGAPTVCDIFNNNVYATNDVIYAGLGQDFFVGRHANGQTKYDFQGNIDEVRFYDRILSIEEIRALAQGSHLPP